MTKKTIIGMAGAIALGLFGAATAQASVISGTPNASFTDSNYTLSLANGAASYSFKDAGPGGYGSFEYASVKTGGSGLVGISVLSGAPLGYFTDDSRAPFISGDLFGVNFEPADSYTKISYSIRDAYLAFAFDLEDGRHYGYAEVAGPQLISYGYETVAGQGIQAGAVATPVPEPGSLAMLSLGLMLIGAGTVTARRRNS